MKPLSKRNIFAKGNVKRQKTRKKEKITTILKTAYMLHFRDKYTRLALKHCLG